MIELKEIALDETTERAPVYDCSACPTGSREVHNRREVVIRLRVDSERDLSRIRDAVANLTAPDGDAASAEPDLPSLPA
jgi:hypothetical protein